MDVLCRRAGCRLRQGRLDAAAEDLERANRLSAQVGRSVAPQVRYGQGAVAAEGGNPARAKALLEEALAATGEGDFGVTTVRARALTLLGRLALAGGDHVLALERFGEVRAVQRDSPLSSDLAEVAEVQAETALLSGAAEEVAWFLGLAVALRGIPVTGDDAVARMSREATELIGPEGFARAFGAGAAMTIDEALTALQTSIG